jgi:hypothetical protein
VRRGRRLDLNRQADSLGALKDRWEQAAAQYLGPVHKLWEGGAKAGGSFSADTRLSAKAKVSGSPARVCIEGPRSSVLIYPGPATVDVGAASGERAPDPGS